MSLKKEAWLVAALDAIAQFRATKEPLRNVVKRLSVQRRLGSRDRAKMSDVTFAWSRMSEMSQDAIMLELKQQGITRPSVRQIDEAIINKCAQGESSADVEYPEWFIAKVTKAYAQEAPELLKSLHVRAGPTLAVDTRYTKISAVTAALDALDVSYELSERVEEAIRIVQTPFRVESLPKALQSHVWIMDESSQYAASQVQAKIGDRVLDYCAGGGGKTRFLSSRGASVVAMDISERRILSAKERCHDDDVVFVVADGLKPPFEDASFEWILVDAPCTGTGTLRRAPDLLMRLKASDIADYVKLQRDLLQNATRLLKPSGVLVYATCSIFPEENMEQVAWAQSSLDLTSLHTLQLLPSKDASDGFFVATLKKK